MITKMSATRIGVAVLALTMAACGKKDETTPAPEDVEPAATEAHAPVAEEPGIVEEAAPVSEFTKVTSQAAAAEQAKGVFAKAAEGDPDAVYLARCQYCHIQMRPGTITLAKRLGPDDALLANRTDLTEDYVKLVVRNGLNTMPAITRVEVSDAELDLIVEYLTRNQSPSE